MDARLKIMTNDRAKAMKILHVQNALNQGGAENMLLQLARQQRKQGHDASVCVLYGPAALDAKAKKFQVPVHHLHCKRTLLAEFRGIASFLKKNRVDVIHTHWGVWLPAALAGFLKNIPVIHTHHSNESRRNFLPRRIASWFTRKVVSLTPIPDEFLRKWVAVPQSKLAIIPNGIDFDEIRSGKPVEIDGIPPGRTVVGMIARLSPPKDYTTFIRAAKLVQKTHPTVCFISAGSGRQEGEFRRLVDQTGLLHFHFLGGRTDVPDLLKRMSINVLSSWNEGLPISLLEAMASECPCIASDIPANRYVLEDGRCGLLFPVGDAEALAAAIVRLIEDQPLRNSLIAQAVKRSAYFELSRMTDDYLDLYKTVVRA